VASWGDTVIIAKVDRLTRSVAETATARQAPTAKALKSLPALQAPALNRARRTVQDDDLVPAPPSSLDLDHTASAVRTGEGEGEGDRDQADRPSSLVTTSPLKRPREIF